MNILLIFSGFILSFIIAICYEYKIRLAEPRNKVRFFIMMGDISNEPYLFIRDVDGNYHLIADADQLNNFGINAF